MITGISSPATSPPVVGSKSAAVTQVANDTDKTSDAAPEKGASKAPGGSPAPLQGFNPALSIDPQSHIVVMTISGPDGKVIKQMPTKQQLASYNAKADKS